MSNTMTSDRTESESRLLAACIEAYHIINSYAHVPALFRACAVLDAAIIEAGLHDPTPGSPLDIALDRLIDDAMRKDTP